MDQKDKAQVIGGMQRLAVGAFGVGVSAVAKDPMAGMAAAAVAMTATDYLKAKLAEDNTELVIAEESVLLDYCARLDERVRKIEEQLVDTGQKPDRQDLLSKEVTFSRFAKGLGEAATVEKREALVHATAYQFDPRKGSPATRDYWLKRVRELPEIHLAFLLLVAQAPRGFLNNRVVSPPPNWTTGITIREQDLVAIPAPEAEVLAYQQAAEELEQSRLIWQTQAGDIRRMVQISLTGGTTHLRTFTLLPQGKVLVSYCKEE